MMFIPARLLLLSLGLFLLLPHSAEADLIGVTVTSPSYQSYVPGRDTPTETMGFYIRPTQDLLVTKLGYYNGWKAFDVAFGGNTIFAQMRLIDDHALGIYEIDPTNFHDDVTPGNGTLIAQTILHVGEGMVADYFEYKSIAPTLLKADHIYAIVGYGSDRADSFFANNSYLDDGDPIGYYIDWGFSAPGLGEAAYGAGFELIGGAWSYLPGLSQPAWYDYSVYGLPYGADREIMYLGPGFQYQFAAVDAVTTPEPISALSWLFVSVTSLAVCRVRRGRRK